MVHYDHDSAVLAFVASRLAWLKWQLGPLQSYLVSCCKAATVWKNDESIVAQRCCLGEEIQEMVRCFMTWVCGKCWHPEHHQALRCEMQLRDDDKLGVTNAENEVHDLDTNDQASLPFNNSVDPKLLAAFRAAAVQAFGFNSPNLERAGGEALLLYDM